MVVVVLRAVKMELGKTEDDRKNKKWDLVQWLTDTMPALSQCLARLRSSRTIQQEEGPIATALTMIIPYPG